MNIELKPIDRSNHDECIALKVDDAQQRFVATNAYSLVQAAYEPQLYPLAVYRDDTMAGFILYDFDTEINGWLMSRFMIDSRFQNQGIGRIALSKFLEFFAEKYPNEKLYTSAEVENFIATKLYTDAGFEKLNEFEYEIDGLHFREMRMVKDFKR